MIDCEAQIFEAKHYDTKERKTDDLYSSPIVVSGKLYGGYVFCPTEIICQIIILQVVILLSTFGFLLIYFINLCCSDNVLWVFRFSCTFRFFRFAVPSKS
jgi:hypothetical protein